MECFLRGLLWLAVFIRASTLAGVLAVKLYRKRDPGQADKWGVLMLPAHMLAFVLDGLGGVAGVVLAFVVVDEVADQAVVGIAGIALLGFFGVSIDTLVRRA